MATQPIVKLTKGQRYLDLMSGRYQVGDDFVPPTVDIAPLIASGTSANRRNGGKKVGERANDRVWPFTVNIINTTSEAEVTRALRDINWFLAQAGDESEPLYIEVRPNSDVAMEPLWGNYGMNLRYEIIHADLLKLSDVYWAALANGVQVPACPVTLTIKPYALGLKQRLASALGCLMQDNLGTTDGISRGLLHVAAFTNKMTNPVFGSSTYSTGWTADASLTASQNVDRMYLLPNTINSAKLVSRATNQRFYQSINVGNTSTHVFFALVMNPDGGAVTVADCQLYYNALVTTTFTSLGNGLYLLTGNTAGINAATNTGIEVKNGRAIYLLAYQCAQVGTAGDTPIIWGDLLGCSWTGTAHASTSSSTAGRTRLAIAVDTFEIAQGSIRIVVKWGGSQAVNADRYLFSCGSTNLRAFFQNSDDTLQFKDNTNTASAAITFSAGQIDVFDFVYSPTGGLVIYRNGAVFATSATYTPPALGTYIYWGTDDSAANPARATIMEAATYEVAPTAAEVLANYNNVLPLLSDGQRVGTLPYLWTKDGDDVVDNGDTSAKDFFAVCDGIPGSVEAETEISIQSSSSSAVPLNISRWETEYFMTPSDLMFKDEGGTVDANANNGDSAVRGPLGTTGTAIVSFTAMKAIQYKLLAEKEVFIFTRIADAGSNLMLALELQLSSSVILTDYYSVSSNASARLLRTPSLVLPSLDSVGLMNNITPNSGFLLALFGKRSTGSANYTIDYGAVFPRPLAIISPNNAGTGTIFILKGGRCLIVDASNNTYIQEKSILGDEIELVPGMVNNLLTLLGDSTFNPDVTLTLTYNRVDITPRWSLA